MINEDTSEERISDLIIALKRMKDAIGDVPIRRGMLFGPNDRCIASDLLQIYDYDDPEFTVLIIG